MKKIKLIRLIENLRPYDSETKVDKLIDSLAERNCTIDYYLDRLICSLISSSSITDYYNKRSALLKRIEPVTETRSCLADLLVKHYPVNNVSKVNLVYDELVKNNYLLVQKDFDYASGIIMGKGAKQQWKKRYDEGREIKVKVEKVGNIFTYDAIFVPQPLATLLVTGAVDAIKVNNGYALRSGDVIHVFAKDYSSEMTSRIMFDIKLWSKYCNSLFTGSYTDDSFPENCFVGWFVIGDKDSNSIEIVNPMVFNHPVIANIYTLPFKKGILSHQFQMKHIELSGRIIIVPVSDDAWNQIEKLEGSIYYYWEDNFDKILHVNRTKDDEYDIWDYEEYAGDKQDLYDILFINGQKQILCQQIDKQAVHSGYYKNESNLMFKALVFDLENILVVNHNNAFNVLQKKDWLLDWNCVRFGNGMMIVSAPLDGRVKFKTKAIQLSGALEAYNYLKDYLNDRLEPIHCSVENMELTIYDTIRLNDAIQKFATASRQRGITVASNTISNRSVVPQQISFSQALSKVNQMTHEEFRKYKSKYIDYLVEQQSKSYKVIPCVERLAHTGNDTTEYAFLFSINCKSGDILIVHENVNPDRSTLLFMVKQENYDHAIRAIYDFLQSAEINKRSSLRSRNVEIKKAGVDYYRSINHEYFYTWSCEISKYRNYYKNGCV